MTPILQWLLDLEDIRLARDAPLLLRWDSPFEPWMLFGLALVGIAWIGAMYRAERTTVPRRIALATIRCAIVALVVAMICRPSLVLQRNRVEPDYVILALDRSMSMAAEDSYHDAKLAASIAAGAGLRDVEKLAGRSRLSLVQDALTRNETAPLRALVARHALQVCTVAGHAEPIAFFGKGTNPEKIVPSVRSIVADGDSTDLAGAIRQLLQSTQGRRLGAVIFATDGQNTQPTNLKDALTLAQGRQIPIYPLRIGSPHRLRDVEIGPLRAEPNVFVNDILSIEARVAARGLTDPVPITVNLIDEQTGKSVAQEVVTLDVHNDVEQIELRTKVSHPGGRLFRVEAEPLPDETLLENNAEQVEVSVLDNRLHILYVDGYPRYEYRYLKNALLREPTMELSVLLFEADEQFVQEGTDPIRRFPETPEELSRYDVVLFGDVDPRGGWLTSAQVNMLLDFVGNEGGGFGVLAGERAVPHRYVGTPLEKLLPIRIDPSFFGRYDAPRAAGFQPVLTREGLQSRIFRFTEDREESRRLFEMLPPLYWYARTLGPKPGASVLVEHPTVRSANGPMPIVVTGRYGAGTLFFQATDDTWRWRRHTGELVHDTYWVRVARELMRSSRLSQSRAFLIQTDRRRYEYGTTVKTNVDVFDSQLLENLSDTISVVVSTVDSHAAAVSSNASVAATAGRFDAYRIAPDSNVFEGTWVAPRPGAFKLEAPDLSVRPGERPASVRVRVDPPNLEARRPEADHDVLESMARATGGSVVDLDQLADVFATIRDRSVQIPDDITEPLWDSKLILLLFVPMISMEWVLRKAFGLL